MKKDEFLQPVNNCKRSREREGRNDDHLFLVLVLLQYAYSKWKKITFFNINFGYLPHLHLICKKKAIKIYDPIIIYDYSLSLLEKKTIHSPMWCMLAWYNTNTWSPSYIYIFFRAHIIFLCYLHYFFINYYFPLFFLQTKNSLHRKIVSICHGEDGFNANNMLHPSSSSSPLQPG